MRRIVLLSCCALLTAAFVMAAVAQGQGGGQQKTTLCHNGSTTITTGNPASTNAHLRHGDTLGPCATTTPPPPPPGVTPGATLGTSSGLTGQLAALEATGFDALHPGCHRGFGAGELAPPEVGNLINAQWVSGEPIQITTPDGQSFCMIHGAVQIPVLSKIDARDSKVEVTSEGSERKASFFDGLFQVLQGDEPHAVTVLKLVGPLQHCDTATSEKPGGRQLWGEGEGSHRTDGRLAAATVSGTKWLVQDRCNGTTFAKVVEGVVTLHDLVTDKTVELEAGDSYVAGPK